MNVLIWLPNFTTWGGKLLTKLVDFPSKWINKKSNSLQKSIRTDKFYTAKIHTRATKLLTITTVIIAKATTIAHVVRSIPQWDTDSGLTVIDNRCSGCMSHISGNFVGELQECKRTIKGFGVKPTTMYTLVPWNEIGKMIKGRYTSSSSQNHNISQREG